MINILDAYFEEFIEKVICDTIIDNTFCLPTRFCEMVESLKRRAAKEISITIHLREEHYSKIECIFIDKCSHKTRNLQISYSPMFCNKVFRFFHTYNGNNENTLKVLDRITKEKNRYLGGLFNERKEGKRDLKGE